MKMTRGAGNGAGPPGWPMPPDRNYEISSIRSVGIILQALDIGTQMELILVRTRNSSISLAI